MAFDAELAGRIRAALKGTTRVVEKRMFGGVAFLLNGNMCVGVHKDAMIVRLDPAATDAALKDRHTRVFDLSGRPMKGWILVDAAGVRSAPAVVRWVDRSKTFVATLPNKKK